MLRHALKQLASFSLPKMIIWSSVYLPREHSARTPLEDDVSLIDLGLSIQFAFHLLLLKP